MPAVNCPFTVSQMCTEAFSLFSSLSLHVCLSVSPPLSPSLAYIPTPIEMAALAWWHNPKKLDLANFISSASCAPGSQPQQKKSPVEMLH